MTYRNLLSAFCADKAEAFCRFRDFMCKRNGTYDYSATGIGWTLWDSSYAVDENNPQLNDWFIIYSPGENGKADIFIQVQWLSNYVKTKGYLSWDPTTHEGSSVYYNNGNNLAFTDTLVNFSISIYGDLNFITLLVKEPTYTRGACFGELDPPFAEATKDTAICASTLSSGSDVSITLDTVPSHWKVGTQVFIRTTHTNNVATSKVEYITIKSIVGNVITADLINEYTTNSKLTQFLCYISSGGTQMLTATCYSMIASSENISAPGAFISLGTGVSYTCPSDFEDKYIMLPIFFQVSVTKGWAHGFYPNTYVIPGISSPMVDYDTLVDVNGQYYRVILVYSNKAVIFKEV